MGSFSYFGKLFLTCRLIGIHRNWHVCGSGSDPIMSAKVCMLTVRAMCQQPLQSRVFLCILVTVTVLCCAKMEDGKLIQYAEICVLRIQGKSVVEIRAKMEDGKLIQYAEICVLRIQGKSVVEIHAELVCLHGGHALSISTVRHWFRKFQQGVTDFSVGGSPKSPLQSSSRFRTFWLKTT